MKPITTLIFALLSLSSTLRAVEADFTIRIYHSDNPRLANTPNVEKWTLATPIFSQQILAPIGTGLTKEYESKGPAQVKLCIDCEVKKNGQPSSGHVGYAVLGTVAYTGLFQGVPFSSAPAPILAAGNEKHDSISSVSVVTGGFWIFQKGHAFLCLIELNPIRKAEPNQALEPTPMAGAARLKRSPKI